MKQIIVALNSNKHRRHSVLAGDISHSETRHICQVYLPEFTALAGECPIIFLKSQEENALESCALLGIKPGQNLFIQQDKWLGGYIPATLRAYPFYLHYKDQLETNPIICVDSSSLSLGSLDGNRSRLFDDEGQATNALLQARNLLNGIHQQKSNNKEFIRCLTEMELFQEQVVVVDLPGNTKHRLTGVFCVTSERMNALDDNDFLRLKERGYLAPIYAHMLSLHQSTNLSRLFKKYQARLLH
ncbi:SapC family protein [Microbulbifer variabilis]|uniref:SapC family protein n=1 Tax=Microbulbifer variabilis TaxID=266805 RepID=A0ABY4VHB2_9GAMM|nr:SapC family protein [Microbulbifer variabilis]USD21827.1 SapC family protein [Microbulbifer variabilis]